MMIDSMLLIIIKKNWFNFLIKIEMEFRNYFTAKKLLAAVVLYALISLGSIITGQALPMISARFSNPRFDKPTKLYYLDIEVSSKATKEYLFGMNVRFFYEGSMMEFNKMDQFSQGYDILGQLPTTTMANGTSGTQLFNLSQSTVFVNGAIQLQNVQTPLLIVPGQWAKVCRVSFKVPMGQQNKKDFCPSVLWDLKPTVGTGGFLMGDDGLVITVLENNPNTPDDSAPAVANAFNFNWQSNSAGVAPYGKPISNTCISLIKLSPTQGDVELTQGKYELSQNEPNPFDDKTSIEFNLPSAQEATLKFYDISGKVLYQITGEYPAGKNTVTLDRQPWMQDPKIVFYLMETEGFRSEMLRMTIINK